MANETTLTTADDLTYSAIIQERVIKELRATMVMPKLMYQKSLAGLPSKAGDFPKWPTMTAASVAEGTDLSNSSISTTKATITAGEVGLMATVTDILEKSDILAGLDEYAGTLARAVSNQIDADCAALLSGFNSGTAVGSSGVNLTLANFLAAYAVCTNANAHKPGPIVTVLHTQQASDLQSDAVTSTGTPLYHINPKNEFYSDMNGYFGSISGVDIFSDTNVPTANTAADRAGGMFTKNYAMGLATKWAIRVELERDASLRATEIVVTSCYGVGELVDAAGCPITTDA